MLRRGTMASVWLPYLVAVAATLVAWLVRVALSSALGGDLPYLTFFSAVMVAAWYGGLRPGLFATGLCLVSTAALLIVPEIDRDGLRPAHAVGLAWFGVTGALMSAAAEQLHRTRESHRLDAERLRT